MASEAAQRYGRKTFSYLVVVLVGLALLAFVFARIASPPPPVAPSWAQLPAPQVLIGVDSMSPCSVGTKVPTNLIPVVMWSGADEEWCSTGGVQATAFDGIGVPVFASGFTSSHGVFQNTIQGRQVDCIDAVYRGGWVATCLWGNPVLPSNTSVILLGLESTLVIPLEKG